LAALFLIWCPSLKLNRSVDPAGGRVGLLGSGVSSHVHCAVYVCVCARVCTVQRLLALRALTSSQFSMLSTVLQAWRGTLLYSRRRRRLYQLVSAAGSSSGEGRGVCGQWAPFFTPALRARRVWRGLRSTTRRPPSGGTASLRGALGSCSARLPAPRAMPAVCTPWGRMLRARVTTGSRRGQPRSLQGCPPRPVARTRQAPDEACRRGGEAPSPRARVPALSTLFRWVPSSWKRVEKDTNMGTCYSQEGGWGGGDGGQVRGRRTTKASRFAGSRHGVTNAPCTASVHARR
jgi:hypothetical protein